MGFSFRKSKSIGPIKINVSKSGIGVSTGVKGARVGVNSKGQGYVSAGAGGVHYRKYQSLGSGVAPVNASADAASVDDLSAENAGTDYFHSKPVRVTSIVAAVIFFIVTMLLIISGIRFVAADSFLSGIGGVFLIVAGLILAFIGSVLVYSAKMRK